MSSPTAGPAAGLSWMQVLDRIEEALAQSLARATLPEAAAPGAGPPGGNVEASLRALDERLAQVQACLARAEQGAAEADALLAAEAAALRGWLEALGEGRKVAG